ncbi:hypothetical protein ACKLNO_05455 [Neisseriaceae bacterium B1]
MKKQVVLGALLLVVASFAAAEVYSCGPGCYTSSPRNGSGRADLGNKIGSYTAVKARVISSNDEPRATQPVRRAASAAPARSVPVAHVAPVATAPKLNSARSGSRRAILEQELNNERNALASAQKALAEGRAVSGQSDSGHQTRIRSLESAVLDRQQNIQALQRELGRM